jgi:hypothetical protein
LFFETQVLEPALHFLAVLLNVLNGGRICGSRKGGITGLNKEPVGGRGAR